MGQEGGALMGTQMQGNLSSSRAQPSRNNNNTQIKRETDVQIKREINVQGPKRTKRVCGADEEDDFCDLTGINAKWGVRKKQRAQEVNLL
jgi:hypothetical protein